MLILPLDNIELLLQCIQEWNTGAQFISINSDVKSIDPFNYHNALHIYVCTTTHKEQSGDSINSIYLLDISALFVLDLLVVRNKQLHLRSIWFNSIYLDTWNESYEIPIHCYSLSRDDSGRDPTKCFYSLHSSP
jgi:hypothetical protein